MKLREEATEFKSQLQAKTNTAKEEEKAEVKLNATIVSLEQQVRKLSKDGETRAIDLKYKELERDLELQKQRNKELERQAELER